MSEIFLNSEWIEKIDYDQLIINAKKLSAELTDNRDNYVPLSTSKLRKFYGEIKRIEAKEVYHESKLLKPKLAYDLGREIKSSSKKEYAIKLFYNNVSPLIDKIQLDSNLAAQQYKNFVKIIEAVVGYHKAFESDKNFEEILN